MRFFDDEAGWHRTRPPPSQRGLSKSGQMNDGSAQQHGVLNPASANAKIARHDSERLQLVVFVSLFVRDLGTPLDIVGVDKTHHHIKGGPR